ncbi:DUF1573 domain-containing protein [Jiulongibacter sp. NS-SX5]|uniref:DUF1573 domain-containing protein n=1 Tax=Jiulongibacter sp. NS-SX5 TaxID=3463854 RepID=UPI00405A0234
MKKVLFTVVTVLFFAAASYAQGVLKFETESHDFGTLEEGPVATYTFKVTNTGSAPVVISRAMASCGCTTPEWSKDPIMPGATSEIKVGYNTSGRPGAFKKTITVTSNAENSTVILRINGKVNPKSSK